MAQRIYLVLSVPLIAFYSTVFYLAANPEVSGSYREYYIDRTSTISPTERKSLRPFIPGAWIDAAQQREEEPPTESRFLLFDGWSQPETSFRWSNGREVSLLFLTEDAGEFVGEIELQAIYLGRQRIGLFLNGHNLGEYVGEGDEDMRKISFDPKLLKSGELNSIVFKLPDARSPRREERRTLAIALKAIRIL